MAKPDRVHEAKRISKRVVDAAHPAKKPHVIWDADIKGFGVKVLPSGKKTYLFKYRTATGTARKPNIGRHGTITAEEARSIAKDWAAEVAKGGDPKGSLDQERTDASEIMTFEETVEKFITIYAKKRQRTWSETQRTLLVNCRGWLNRPITSITRAEVYDLLEGYIAQGTESKARLTLAWLRKMFAWSVKRGLLESSVIDGVEIYVERKSRDRFYSDDEIRAAWQAADQLDPIEAGYCKLIVLLGVRKTELAQMARSEFDDPVNPTLWTVPHERVKARKSSTKKRVYLVPLPALAVRIIKSLPKSAGSDLVFPGRHHGKPIKPAAWLSDKIREKSGVSDWGYHAQRHTISTWMENEGYSEYERALVLNHASTSVTAGYSHGHSTALKAKLLEEWADHIESLLAPAGVALLS